MPLARASSSASLSIASTISRRPKQGETPVVVTYPISVGKMDWKTPLGLTRIVDKRVRPTGIRQSRSVKNMKQTGGHYRKPCLPVRTIRWVNMQCGLGIPGGAYLIHGTNRPAGVGMQVTHGCIRMYPGRYRAVLQA